MVDVDYISGPTFKQPVLCHEITITSPWPTTIISKNKNIKMILRHHVS